MKRLMLLSVLCLSAFCTLFGQYKSKYPDIPIVDVHIHPRAVSDVTNFIKVSETIKEKYGSNLAFWIGFLNNPSAEMIAAGNNRFLYSVTEMRPHKGVTTPADEIVKKVREGYVGLKFWFGDPSRVLAPGERGITHIDDIRLADYFAELERGNVLMTSLHIADPNQVYGDRGEWFVDPVDYWSQIRAFENVVAKYPKLTIIAAHGAWLVCQDAQLDYLRYMLSTYPNLYLDLAAVGQYIYLLGHENIRDFFIEYQDRFVFGTDGGRIPDDSVESFADRYAKFFAILESDLTVQGSFFGDMPTKGLYLPKEVLEKIYYKNALKLYPGLKAAMKL